MGAENDGVWLTRDEVEELTERKRFSAQCRKLAEMSIPFRPNAAGRPLVERSVVLKATGEKRRKPQKPDFSSLAA